MSVGILIAVGLVLALFWFTLAVVRRGRIADLEHSHRLVCKRGGTARADQVEAELRTSGHHVGGLVGGVAGNSAKSASLIGEADSGLGVTRHSISTADSEEALKADII
ncbi:hypothetical protein ABT255_01740 [Streptomyces mirabilis]|uniref:hypothetical protein n=1 Tax=Streptomyces mirabilis TaxID=68239 RepID=UPI00332C5F7A